MNISVCIDPFAPEGLTTNQYNGWCSSTLYQLEAPELSKDDDLSAKTVRELHDLARDRGIDVPVDTRKAELVAALEASDAGS